MIPYIFLSAAVIALGFILELQAAPL